ncbi:Maf family protein [Radiobacillus sp. PE A8.2]|uniref:Maf family protein n=1 Tax=Radiobacillus sp. PE A8.2 TaxID=3380349 RepID=UPI00388D0E5C
MNQLILASSSPRRKQLLQQIGIPFKLRIPDVDESTVKGNSPKDLVEVLAQVKGEAVDLNFDEVVLSADTVVSFQGEILTKPTNDQHAFEMLSMLRGKQHTVHTGVMLRSKQEQIIFSAETIVEFWDVTDELLWEYIRSGDPLDKAGAYGIQSQGAVLVKSISGDYFTVVGLPISLVVKKLEAFDIFPTFSS